MYLNFYNLKKEFFHITPDPEFLFLCQSNRQAIGAIIWGVSQKKGFIAVTGDVGVGKTTTLRYYLETVDRRLLKIIYLFNANVSFPGLLKTSYKELGLESGTDDMVEMVNHLHEILIEEYKQGRSVLLIIDEAQNMPVKTLENLRMLSNLETSTDKLIQIVLIGQPEFEEKLNQNELRQLNQRIAIRSRILPLTEKESIDYIKHRLAKAGQDEKDRVFTRGAMKKFARQAKGIPRTLNILCDNAWITGFGYKKRPVNSKIVKEVIADFKGRAKPSLLRWVLAPAALIIFVAGAFLVYPHKDLVLSGLENPVLPKITEQNEPEETVRPSVGDRVLFGTEQSVPVEEKIEPVEKEIKPVPRKSFPLIQVVEYGDSLSGLSKKIYGYADNKLLERVKQKNPRIKDVNKILAGQKIIFPEIAGTKAKVEVKAEEPQPPP